ncbi:MAG TPA: hypothetical protein VMV10_04265 [Pirellulales bacterium]|nr:hypothetical protein [Pirellulales bacterium]
MIAEPSHPSRVTQLPGLAQESAYERVASMLLALLILIGVAVFILVIAWLGSGALFPLTRSVPVTLAQVEGGAESGFAGESMQLDSPTPQDVARESELVEPEFQHSLTAVLAAVALRKADLDAPADTEQDAPEKGGSRQRGEGTTPGKGDGAGRPGIPPQLRWQIHFDAGGTLESYAKQLDFFHVELGVIDGKRLMFARNLAQPKPDTYTSPGGRSEQRLYFSWRHGKLAEADRELAQRAGIATAGKIVLQFYSRETEQELLRLEQEYRGLAASKIRKTVFGIRPKDAGYEFFVIDQMRL